VRIEIDFSAANDPDAHQWLDRILYRIEDGWHVWDTAGQPNPGAIEASTWIRDGGRQGDRVRELLVASVQRDAWTYAPHGRRMRVTACPNASDELTPEDASRLADLPPVILVENRISDGAFVKRVVTELDKSLHRLWQRLNEPIQLDSVGGVGQMLAEVERRSQGRRYRPRLVVIADSDRKGPDDTASPTVRALCRRCEALGVPCWVLAKREADNYLPRVLLDERQDAGADHVRLVEAWDRLNDDQKNFFDMKNGLPESLFAMEQALFGKLSSDDRTILSRGFGPNLSDCWTLWSKVQAKTELLACGQGDLEHGIELIRGEV